MYLIPPYFDIQCYSQDQLYALHDRLMAVLARLPLGSADRESILDALDFIALCLDALCDCPFGLLHNSASGAAQHSR